MKRFQTLSTIASLCLMAVIALLKLQAGSQERPVVPSEALRILPTSSDQVDILSLFVEPSDLVAIPSQALVYSRIAMGDERFKALPSYDRFIAETVIEREPNLVIVSPFISADTKSQIKKFGIQVLSLEARHDWSGLEDAIRSIGEAVGRSDLVAGVLAKQRVRLKKLAEKVALSPSNFDRLRVLSYTNFGTGGWGAGEGLSIDFVIKSAGLKNAAVELNREDGAFSMSFEDLIQLDPDYIILTANAEGGVTTTEQTLLANKLTAALRAVKTGSILRLPANLMSASSQEMITAAAVLHDLWLEAEKKRDQH